MQMIDWYLLSFFFVFADFSKGKHDSDIENKNEEQNPLINKSKLFEVDTTNEGLASNSQSLYYVS